MCIPPEVVEAILSRFPTDMRRKRKELVRAWLSSSLDYPCWWQLVQALRAMLREELAQEILIRYSTDIYLQEKLLAPQYHWLQPDKEFLEAFTGVVGLSDNEAKTMKNWIDREFVTYRGLCHTIPLIPVETFSQSSATDCDAFSQQNTDSEFEPVTPLLAVIKQGDIHQFRQILSDGGLDVNEFGDREGLSALMIACIYGRCAMAELLLENGAKVDLQDHSGWSALMHAIKCGHVDIAKLLLGHGADVDLQSAKCMESALSLALCEEDSAMVTVINEKIANSKPDTLDEETLQGEAKDTMASAVILESTLLTAERLPKSQDELQQANREEINEVAEPSNRDTYEAVPLSMRTLTLLKWKDSKGQQCNFYLGDKISSKWRKFGYLFGREENELVTWEDEFRGKALQCWYREMSDWLANDGTDEYPTTWRGLIILLEDAECREVARELERALRSAIVSPKSQKSASAPTQTVSSKPTSVPSYPFEQFILPAQLPTQTAHLLSLLLLPQRHTCRSLLLSRALPTPQLLLLSLLQQPHTTSSEPVTPTSIQSLESLSHHD